MLAFIRNRPAAATIVWSVICASAIVALGSADLPVADAELWVLPAWFVGFALLLAPRA